MCLVRYQLSFLFPLSCYGGGRGGSEIVLNGSPSAMMKCVLDNWGNWNILLLSQIRISVVTIIPQWNEIYPRVVLMLQLATNVSLPFVAITSSHYDATDFVYSSTDVRQF